MHILTAFRLLSFVLTIILSSDALALRCGSDLVDIGDRKFEVLRICGEPLFIEKWTDSSVILQVNKNEENGDVNINTISTAHVEEWTYNFGPRQFIYFLTFVDGKLTGIEDGPKGFTGDFPSDANIFRCDSLISEGKRKIEVIAKCGIPDVIEYFGEDHISLALEQLKTEGVFKRRDLLVNVEEWTYNLGPRKFLLFIKFENGRVTRIERGDYGFKREQGPERGD